MGLKSIIFICHFYLTKFSPAVGSYGNKILYKNLEFSTRFSSVEDFVTLFMGKKSRLEMAMYFFLADKAVALQYNYQ